MTFCLLLLDLLHRLLRHPRKPVEEHGAEDVHHNVDKQQSDIAPAVRVVDVDGLEELVRRRGGADPAERLAGGVEQLALGQLDEVAEEVAARHSRWRGEFQDLALGAGDVGPGDAGRQHGRDVVREGRHAVHEDPEAGHLLRGGQDTTTVSTTRKKKKKKKKKKIKK